MQKTNDRLVRYISPYVAEFLEEKMVFVGGPRQVGKTTLCLSFLSPSNPSNPAYLNWDDIRTKPLIRTGQIPATGLTVLDEIHKFKNWRGLVKGFYDKRSKGQNFLITGSARLDYYRRGGDSLLGRYRYLRLHPFSLPELKQLKSSLGLQELLKFGGFPEPLFSGSERKLKFWHRERLQRVVNDDIRDLESIRGINQMELLAEALPLRAGSLLSINALSEDLEVSPHTTKHWLDILEQVYYSFRLSPFGAPKIRAVKKERKLYLWDWSAVESVGARFENLVASHLLKYCHFIEDTQADSMELRYVRDTDGREVDFVVLKNKKPLFAVECKTGESSLSRHIRYFRERTAIPQFFQVHLGTRDYMAEANVRVLPFQTFCELVDLV